MGATMCCRYPATVKNGMPLDNEAALDPKTGSSSLDDSCFQFFVKGEPRSSRCYRATSLALDRLEMALCESAKASCSAKNGYRVFCVSPS
jgi:hypothetical protein